MMPELVADGMLIAGDAAAMCLAAGIWLEGVNFAIGSGAGRGRGRARRAGRRRHVGRRPGRLPRAASRPTSCWPTTASCGGRPSC